MTRFQFKERRQTASVSSMWKRQAGLAWLCFWLLVAGGFGYRHLTHETSGEVQAGVAGPAKTKPIEQIRVAERVSLAINPTEELDESFSFDVNSKTWRKITLKTSEHEVVLLRPATWVSERLDWDGKTIMLSVPEIGIDEPAEVVSIWPCPPIAPGKGRIVLGTFTHLAPETICMYLDGLAEPIRCTPNHITWSPEQKNFVEAHELQAGHLVLCDDGVRKITRVERIAEPIRVYNLEVQGQHVYQVSSLGMLVHNTSPGERQLLDELDDLSRANAERRRYLEELKRVKDELMGSGNVDTMRDVQRQIDGNLHMIELATRRIDEVLRLLGY